MAETLRAEGVRKHYDGVQALRGAGFSLAAGEVHALMGENGAGKSTLAKIVAGSVRADAGQIFLDGKQVEIKSPLDAQRLGIGIIYQELDLFPHLSIAENIAVGRPVKFRELNRFAQPFLDRVGLAHSPRTMLGSLRPGEMQLVAIARALASHARVLIMDEPTSSLFDDAVERLFRLIAELKHQGVGIVYVSHRMDEIFRISDRVTVLRDGATVGTRAIAETTPDELIRMMVGRDLPSGAANAGGSRPFRRLLSVTNLSTKKLQNISFELRKGEVLGIAGLVGAGRSEIGAALFGLDDRLTGSVYCWEWKAKSSAIAEQRKSWRSIRTSTSSPSLSPTGFRPKRRTAWRRCCARSRRSTFCTATTIPWPSARIWRRKSSGARKKSTS